MSSGFGYELLRFMQSTVQKVRQLRSNLKSNLVV
jgi:hypothetical protein